MKILLILTASACLLAFTTGCSSHRKHHKMMWHMMDVNEDGMVSKSEYTGYHTNKFQEMDANNDGQVTKEEKKAYKKSKKGCGCKGKKKDKSKKEK